MALESVITSSALILSMSHCVSRSLVKHVNTMATRRSDVFNLRRGKAIAEKVKGSGKYKSFTAKTMLKATFFGS